ncbi:uncharacterized protein LOC131853529 [Achroia grisella]|uniref:uncharacterized protein LOC131853529 n=1 Tax=Achroia grisella TaxID=688607 RepID=UPI0027D2F7BD|nr:uncharacterized protein LOC131853529 [Achroia grisella]
MTDHHTKSISKLLFQSTTTAECDCYKPDNVFNRFKLIEFPISFVGLSSTQYLDVEVDLNTSAYLKTMHAGKLLKFNEAREISESHRAFDVTPVDKSTIQITFKPLPECITRAKRAKQFDNRFVFDLRLIQVDGIRCCNNEFHSEVGRYYICGEFEYCTINHYPKKLNFGDIVMNAKSTKYIRLINESKLNAAKIQYIRITGFEVQPQKCCIPPNSSKRLSITMRPTCLKVNNTLTFKIRNPHDLKDENDENYLRYTIKCNFNIICNKHFNNVIVESLHKLNQPEPHYTYLHEELQIHANRQTAASKYLQICKMSHFKKPVKKNECTEKKICSLDTSFNSTTTAKIFCKKDCEYITSYNLFDILLSPFFIDFGRVGFLTYGEQDLIIKNNSKYNITVKLLNDHYILYTDEKIKNVSFKLKTMSTVSLKIFCLGFVEGYYRGTFEYTIDEKYKLKHNYCLQIGNPTLMIMEKSLKFGMVTTESFITSVPIRIYNYFNIAVDFKWDELHPDTPFDIIPNSGTIPKHTCKICDVLYVSRPSKTKTHEVDFVSQSKTSKVIPIELNIITRKLCIKFLQSTVIFKDIALNLETIERVKLENSSREIALFHVVEPLIPGFRIEPMSGTIRPKMIITFEIIVKISCILEFAFDIYVKINNKENIILPVSGNIVEPRLVIHPKHIYMSRVPCNMITYVPVTFQNFSTLKSTVEILDTGDENIFNVYSAQGNDKQKIIEFHIEGGQSKTVFIKVFDVFRREYEMYIPFKINRLLGPPDQNSCSTDLQYYISQYEQLYENNSKVRLKSISKDISFCKVTGVITVPWIQLSPEKFEIEYIQNGTNAIEFTMTNVSKYYLFITILISKLSPNFTLHLRTEENQSATNETQIKFELERKNQAGFCLKFHPKGHGIFASTAILYLDKHMTTPYYNLTFIGKRQAPIMIPSTYRIVFPPCYVGTTISRIINLKLEAKSDLESFSCVSQDEPNLTVKFIDLEAIPSGHEYHTIVHIEITVCCQVTYSRNLTLTFNHESGSGCEIETSFCFTYCPLTLHTRFLVKPIDNPYPYFPISTQIELYEYLETCSKFLEKWMFQQGFRRDLYPVIPDTFHAISSAISSQPGTKTKGMNVSYLNFVRRIAGPLMKHIRKISLHGIDDSFKSVKEIHDTYREIINLLKSRGANLWVLQARFLLSFDQFVIYSENVTPKYNADIILTRELLADMQLFNRLNKQSWIDFILQSYKVFVMDSCFFDCVCVSSQRRDIIKILIDWYNDQIALQQETLLGKSKPYKIIENITSDLSDGIALASAIISYCPFMKDYFTIFCKVDEENKEGSIINNACLIIEALNLLRLYFPLTSRDLLQPNFLQMLFLSIHLYVTLPMFKPKDFVNFNPPLLRSSTRQVAIAPATQEYLIFNYIILNNIKNNFTVEKAPTSENGKKMFLSVKYIANFVSEETCILLIHGYNKTRIFDTYVVITLHGHIGALNPLRKCKVTGPLYRPIKVDILVSSPFAMTSTYQLYLTDNEPTIPVIFEYRKCPRFYLRRLNLIDNEISLSGLPKESGQEIQEHKLYLQLICLSTQTGNSWIWFTSDVGQFFVRVTSQPRWDLAIDTLQANVHSWPMDPCSCGEACECYRTTVLMIPHRNDLMIKSLRYALLEHASIIMMQVFDQLIETSTGKIILGMLLTEGGTNMLDVQHILRNEITYRVSSRTLFPRLDSVTLAQHTSATLPLPITVSAQDKSEKYSVTLTSNCGMDIRTYRILFIETSENFSNL